METDEVIWADIDTNTCVTPGPADGKQLRCMHHLLDKAGHRFCGGTKGVTSVWPCEDKPRILVSKQEYLTWKLTK